MKEFWRSRNRLLVAVAICLLSFSSCWSLNEEGVALLKLKEEIVGDPHGALSNWVDEVGVENPCSWFGVGCSQGYVVDLNLRDLCLRGTLSPHIGNLIHLKSLILRNNSFSGAIPEDIAEIKGLEVLDVGYNNFSGHLPCRLGHNLSMTLVLLDNNQWIVEVSPEIYELQKVSEVQIEEELLSASKKESCDNLINSWNSWETRDVAARRLLQEPIRRPIPPFKIGIPFPPDPDPSFPPPDTPAPTPAPSPTPTPAPASPPAPTTAPPTDVAPSLSPPPFLPSAKNTSQVEEPSSGSTKTSGSKRGLILGVSIGGSLLLLLLIVGFIIFRYGKVTTVKPWATGLSGQLQRAFVTGVPKLKRSELEAACEDFSNVIGSTSVCTFYKGTLSSGVEIAVASVAMASRKDWSSNLETQFRKKIASLSKVSHKNFVSLLGFCEEAAPFTRMMVFEYAPNGTLFEHIHIKEAEHLEWATRLRIAMGIAYCLEHMHQLSPPLAHRNLTSSSIYLTEDYAAKVSDIVFWDEAERQPEPHSDVYSFGVILFEMVTGRLPYTAGSSNLEDWASDYLRGTQPLREMVDPTLRTYEEDQLQEIGDLIKWCVDPDPKQRPSMKEVCARLREITGIGPDGAIPKLSPLWWAELEILSSEAS